MRSARIPRRWTAAGSDRDLGGLTKGPARTPRAVEHGGDRFHAPRPIHRHAARRLSASSSSEARIAAITTTSASREPGTANGASRDANRQIPARHAAENAASSGARRRRGRFAARRIVAAARLDRQARPLRPRRPRAGIARRDPDGRRPGSRADSTELFSAKIVGHDARRRVRVLHPPAARAFWQRDLTRVDAAGDSQPPWVELVDRRVRLIQAANHVLDDRRQCGPVRIGHRRVHRRARTDVEDRLAARRRVPQNLTDVGERVDRTAADLSAQPRGASRSTRQSSSDGTTRSRRGGRRAASSGSDADRSEVKTTAARSAGPSSSTIRCAISQRQPRLPFLGTRQRIVHQHRRSGACVARSFDVTSASTSRVHVGAGRGRRWTESALR